MLFSSIPFLFWFLPGVLILYAAAPGSLKNTVLLLSSLFFYGWGEPRYVIWMMLAILMAYLFGLLIERYQNVPKLSRLFLALSVSSSLLMLGYFKYADFFIRNVDAVTGCSISLLNITLPIGISFYTFQILSYTVDVYRQDVKAQRNLIDLAAYVALFPQLIAGPIVRYSDIAEQLKGRIHTMDKTAQGIRRFILGLGKKILIANLLGELCSIFRTSDDKSVLFFWLYAVAYTLHVYFDFSGYSDMAIGLGKLFGFDFLENFNYPFISKSITEFWRRWHISLSSWLKDYLYISLGGNRKGRARTYANLMLTMLLGGLWHGAAVRFILWGALHGAALAVHKALMHAFPSVFKASGEQMRPWRRVLGVLVTFHVVCLGWILFRAPDMQTGERILSQIFGHFQWRLIPQVVSGYGAVMALMAAGYLLHMLPRRAEAWGERTVAGAPLVVKALMLTVLIWCVMQIKSSEIQPFIYFQF